MNKLVCLRLESANPACKGSVNISGFVGHIWFLSLLLHSCHRQKQPQTSMKNFFQPCKTHAQLEDHIKAEDCAEAQEVMVGCQDVRIRFQRALSTLLRILGISSWITGAPEALSSRAIAWSVCLFEQSLWQCVGGDGWKKDQKDQGRCFCSSSVEILFWDVSCPHSTLTLVLVSCNLHTAAT